MNLVDPGTQSSKQTPRRLRRGIRLLIISIATVLIALTGLVALPVLSPELGATVADELRSIVGPEPVAQLESLSFKIQDAFNQTRFQLSGGQPQMGWADTPLPPALTTPTSVVQATSAPTPPVSQTQLITPSMTPRTAAVPPLSTPTSTPLPSVVDAPPLLDGGWQSFGSLSKGQPVMARASFKPDPARPYAQVALIRIDLSRAELHLMPGTVEPALGKGLKPFPRPGVIPAEIWTSEQLLAAFNGGFKAVHGHYGMMVDYQVIQPPLDGIATLAFYHDGHVRLGAWGRDITSTLDLVTYRQNCPLLVDAGQINSSVVNGSRKEWGYTVHNLDTTWRSGLGLSQDGRFLIYAVGNSLTVEALARALQHGGAFAAMQLDINGFYTRFVTYQPAGNAQSVRYPVAAHRLLNQMPDDQLQFLKPYDRDFFYVTVRQNPSATD